MSLGLTSAGGLSPAVLIPAMDGAVLAATESRPREGRRWNGKCRSSAGEGGPVLEKVQLAIEKIRPALQMDGGDVELVAVEEGGVVKIRLQGACTSCPSIGMTLQHAIEKSIKETIPEVTRVVNLEPGEENHA